MKLKCYIEPCRKVNINYNPNMFVSTPGNLNKSLNQYSQEFKLQVATMIGQVQGLHYNATNTTFSHISENTFEQFVYSKKAGVFTVLSQMHPKEKRYCVAIITTYASMFYEQYKIFLDAS